MSRKNRLDEKRARRMRRALRVPLRAQINLEDYLVLYGHAKNKAEAKKVIHEHRVRSESHTLGFITIETKDENDEVIDTQDVYNPFVPASVRSTIEVVPFEAVASSES